MSKAVARDILYVWYAHHAKLHLCMICTQYIVLHILLYILYSNLTDCKFTLVYVCSVLKVELFFSWTREWQNQFSTSVEGVLVSGSPQVHGLLWLSDDTTSTLRYEMKTNSEARRGQVCCSDCQTKPVGTELSSESNGRVRKQYHTPPL